MKIEKKKPQFGIIWMVEFGTHYKINFFIFENYPIAFKMHCIFKSIQNTLFYSNIVYLKFVEYE